MSEEVNQVVIIVLAGTALMAILVIFIVSLFFRDLNRKLRFQKEKASLILTSQIEIKEETMRYISRELHDNVVQMLSLVKIQLNQLQLDLPQVAKIGQSKEYLNTAILDLRALSKTLNTDNILHEGLANTIQFELQRLQKASGVNTQLRAGTKLTRLDTKQEIIVFRIFQELSQNILKHAFAKNMNVCLEEDEKFFKLEIEDDGIGFDFEEKLKQKGFDHGSGLANMAYRASLLEGSFQVLNASTGGSKAILRIPIHTNT